jgi:mannose-1-phosphate guanylyltransferase
VWRVGDFLDDVRRLTPEVAPALHAYAHDIRGFFGAVTPISVDVGVLERSDRVVVLAGDFGWDDVGTGAPSSASGRRTTSATRSRAGLRGRSRATNVCPSAWRLRS